MTRKLIFTSELKFFNFDRRCFSPSYPYTKRRPTFLWRCTSQKGYTLAIIVPTYMIESKN